MANILLISENKSFIIASLIDQLEGKQHKVLQAYNNPSEIGKLKEEINTCSRRFRIYASKCKELA